MLDNVYFGIFLTLLFYIIASYISKKSGSPLANPIFMGTVGIILVLVIFNIPLSHFQKGGSIFDLLLVVATVALAVPLYKNFELLKENALAIISGALVGSLVSVASVMLLGKLVGLDKTLIESILPKSVTSGMAIPLVADLAGIPSITAFSVIIAGVSGAVFGPSILKFLKVDDPVAFGVAMGVSSHVAGTAKAMEVGEKEGTISSLCIVLTGLITIIIFPIAIKFI